MAAGPDHRSAADSVSNLVLCVFMLGLSGLVVYTIHQNNKLESTLHHMPTKEEFDAALADLNTAITQATQRVIDKINDLISKNPDLTDELASIRSDITAINQIAPPTVPPAP